MGMSMRNFLRTAAIVAIAATAMTSAASAAVTVKVNALNTNYAADLLAVPDSKIIWDFDTIFATGYDYTPATDIDIGNTPNVARQPLGDNTVYGTVNFLQSPAIFSADKGLTTFSWLVGSPDSFNRAVFKRKDGTVIGDLTGAALFGPTVALGGLDRAHRITYGFGGERAYSIEFYSNVNKNSFALEYDRFAGTVPEPATWAMMLVGFFGFGSVLRRARKSQTAVATA